MPVLLSGNLIHKNLQIKQDKNAQFYYLFLVHFFPCYSRASAFLQLKPALPLRKNILLSSQQPWTVGCLLSVLKTQPWFYSPLYSDKPQILCLIKTSEHQKCKSSYIFDICNWEFFKKDLLVWKTEHQTKRKRSAVPIDSPKFLNSQGWTSQCSKPGTPSSPLTCVEGHHLLPPKHIHRKLN